MVVREEPPSAHARDRHITGLRIPVRPSKIYEDSVLEDPVESDDFEPKPIVRGLRTPSLWQRSLHFVKNIISLLLLWNNQHRVKQVNVSSSVLQTYHKSHLYGRLPLSGRFRSFIRKGNIGFIWYVLDLHLAMLSGVLYVYSTYVNDEASSLYIKYIQDFISIVFFLDYILRVLSEPALIHYIFSIRGIVELLSFLPMIFLFKAGKSIHKFINLLQLVRIIRVFSCFGEIGIVGSTVAQQIILLIFSTTGLVFLDAGILQWLESSDEIRSPLSYWDSFYFLIVTVCTVGYGDVVPKTKWGQALAVVTIIAAFVVLPLQITRLTLVTSKRPYGTSISSWKIVDSRFVIVSGSVTLQVINEFLSELFNRTHDEDLKIYPLCVVIMAPFRPSFELQQTLTLYGDSVIFVEGSPMCQTDLERVNATKAAAFYLLANGNAKDPTTEDAAQIIRALAVQRFCMGNVRIIVEVLEPETQGSAVWGNYGRGSIEVVCPSKIHYKILSRSCQVKGLYTLIANLFTSPLPITQLPSDHFVSEYHKGFRNNLYPVIFSSVFHGLLFEEAVDFIFNAFNVLLIGLDVAMENLIANESSRIILLFPRGHFLDEGDVGLVIAQDLQTVYLISKLVGDVDFEKQQRSFNKPTEATKKLQFLQQVSKKWTYTKSRASIANQVNLESNETGIDVSTRAEPSSPRGHGKLKRHLLTVMSRGLPHQSLEEQSGGLEMWSDSVGFITIGDFHNKDEHESLPGSSGGRSIGLAAEELLTWPPNLQYGRPHPAVVGRKTDTILKSLEERTLSIVELGVPHLLVCCQGKWPSNMYYFLAGIRMPGFHKPPVVILSPHTPSAFQWGSAGIFDDVYFLQGSPLYDVDLLRAGILQAGKIVVLCDQGRLVENIELTVENTASRKYSPAYTSDVDNIVIAANIEQILGKVADNLIVEMQHMTALQYVQPQYPIPHNNFVSQDYKRNPNGVVHYAPPYMQGKAVSGSMLGFLLRFLLYNKNTISIIEQLIDGGPVKAYNGLSKFRRRIVDQMEVPEEYVNCPYSKLFTDFLAHHSMLALGLYRGAGTMGSLAPYVHTNPHKDTIVLQTDLVFLLK